MYSISIQRSISTPFFFFLDEKYINFINKGKIIKHLESQRIK